MYYFFRFMRNIAVLLLAVCLLLGIIVNTVHSAEIKGADVVNVGELNTFESSIPGDVLIYPKNGIGLAKDTNKQRFYVVGLEQGVYTLIFFGIEDNAPALIQYEFVIGKGNSPAPIPTPEPAPKYNLSTKEKETVVWAIDSVLNHISRGTIRTPQGARATFKTAIAGKVEVSEGLGEALDAWTKEIDMTDVDTMKSGLEKIKKDLE